MGAEMSRQQERLFLRRVSDQIVKRMVPLTRAQRRLTARVYANAVYRVKHGLAHELYGGAEHGYMEFTPHPAMVKGIWKSVEKYEQESQETQSTAKENEESLRHSCGAHNGEEQHSVPADINAGAVPEVSEEA